MTQHNHGPNFGIPVDDCPRCEELRCKPYVLVYKLGRHRRIQRVPVASVRQAQEVIQAELPDTVERIPVVETPGHSTVAILRIV